MNLLDSLLDAIVRLNGDALVMHVGEKPYVVTTSEAANEFRGPLAWGQVELSTRVLTTDAVSGMVGQILPLDQRAALDDFGATEYEVRTDAHPDERFSIVAARGGDDIWVEMRRHPKLSSAPQLLPSDFRAFTRADESIAREASGDPAPEYPVQTAAASAAPDAERREHQPEELDVQPLPEPSAVPAVAAEAAPADGESFELEMEPEPFLISGDVSDLEPGVAAGSQEWTDDVMTERDLGELLRGSAAAVITGHDEAVPGDTAVLEDTGPQMESRNEPFASMPAEPAERATDTPSDSGYSREIHEVPALVEYQMERESMQLGDTSAGFDEEVPLVLDSQLDSEIAALIGTADNPPHEMTETASAPAEHTPYPEDAAVMFSASEAAESEADTAPGTGEDDTVAEEEPMMAPARPAAVVLPLTRQVRGEGASDSRATPAATLQRLLRLAATRGAASVYVVANAAPLVRIDGEFSALEGEPALSATFLERLLAEVAPGGEGSSTSAEWLIDVPEIGRVRCVRFRDHRGPGIIFRMVPPRAISADQLGLPAEVQALCSEADGLVLVTGGRGSGKSTLLTSFLDLVNRTRSDYIISIETQLEFLHENRRSFVSQREVRGEEAVLAAVRAACREEPDVLIVEEVRSHELASLALEAAESGRLVFASVPGASAASAVERLIELFPADRREKVQAALASTLRGVISQVLLRKMRGGRIAAREILLNTPAVANLIAGGKTFQLQNAIESGRRAGMMSMAESLASLVREGVVHPAHAYRKAPNREQLLAALRRDGVDVTATERLG